MTQPHTLYVFGTGNATMTRYYNTCFAIRSGEEYFMTDAGGGNASCGFWKKCRFH